MWHSRGSYWVRRWVAVASATLVLGVTFMTVDAVNAEPADAAISQGLLGDGCGNLPVISAACEKVASITSWAPDCASDPTSCVGGVGTSVVADTFDYFVRWVAVGALATIDLQWDAMTNTTTPHIDPGSSVFQSSMLTARALAVPLLVAAAIYSLLKRDANIVVKSAIFYLPGSVIGMVVSGYFINLAIDITDELSLNYVGGTQYALYEWLTNLQGVIAAGVGVTAPILLVIMSFLFMAASLVLWLIMLVRAAAIMVVYAFMPLAFAAMIFPSTRGWIKRLFEVQMSFILAKPVIFAVLTLGATTVNEVDNALVAMLHASALFLLASFAPFALMKLLPLVGDEAVAAMEQPSRAPSRAMATAAGVVGGTRAAAFLAGTQQQGTDGAEMTASGGRTGGEAGGGNIGSIGSAGTGQGAGGGHEGAGEADGSVGG